MSNFGFEHLRLVRPYDPSWQEARSAVGAAAVLARAEVFDTVQAAVADCSLVVGTASVGARELRQPVRRLEAGGRLLRAHAGRAALLFGSEKYGLSNDDLSLCHWLMRIPTREAHESMNLGQAVAVCLYELVRTGKRVRSAPGPRKAAAAKLDRFEEQLMEVLTRSGYVNAKTAASTRRKVRHLLRRMDLREQDGEIWLGMLRQILWKLSAGREA